MFFSRLLFTPSPSLAIVAPLSQHMAPTSAMLQGLNIIHQSPQQSFADQNDLANEPLSHDLAAQLELWSSVNFASDEPLLDNRDRDSVDCLDNVYDSSKSSQSGQQQPSSTLIDSTLSSPPPTSLFPNYDSYLSGFPASVADTFSVPAAFGNMMFPHSGSSTASGHDNSNNSVSIVHPSLNLGHFTRTGLLLSPPDASFAHDHEQQQNRSAASVRSRGGESSPPAAKKSRTSLGGAAATSRVKSISTPPSHTRPSLGSADADQFSDEYDDTQTPPPHQAASGTTGTAAAASGGKKDISTPVSATEDKRRRNTAASARFRLKKKEREQAMERRAKDLEGRVGELERECEALRRENGWLKGLVVGVTGSVPGTAPADAAGVTGFAPPPTPVPASTTAGGKRDRDEV